MTTSSNSHDVTRTTLAVLCIGALIAATFWVLRPFLVATIWAVMIVIPTWPILLGVQQRLGGKRWAAVTVMLLAILLLLVIPAILAILAIIDHADEAVSWARSLTHLSLPPPPEWLYRIPLAGERLAAGWAQLATVRAEDLSARLAPYAAKSMGWFLEQVGSAAIILVRFLLTLIIAAILYAKGETAAEGVLAFAGRLAGRQGRGAAILAGNAIRGVALGVVLTGLIQAGLGGVGLLVAGVPGTALLTGIIFVLCLAQVGPMPVLLPAVGWLYWSGETLWGTILLAWTLFVGTFDNFLRPILIRRGVDLPMTLVFTGVLGGMIAFGVIGLFIGPVVLAVTYTLLAEWVRGGIARNDGTSVH